MLEKTEGGNQEWIIQTLATLGTQDTERRQTKQKQNGTQHHTT